MLTRKIIVPALLLFLPVIAFAAQAERGVTVRAAVVYLAPDVASDKLITAERGREVAILERTKGWLHVLATVSQKFGNDRDISGWIQDKGVITAATPNGDQIMYGEAVDSESEASRRGGRKGAAGDARRLYARMAEYFPQSPLAGEALYRAADIQWQMDKDDIEGRKRRPTSDSNARPKIEEEPMKQVIKRFPRTKWADLAAFHLLDNKLCLEWQAQSKCPEKEAEVFEDYAKEHPNSPAAAEAWYNAASRHAALIEIYKVEGQQKKSPQAAQHAVAAAQQALAKNSSPDWNARAQRLIYMVQNNIPVFGNAAD